MSAGNDFPDFGDLEHVTLKVDYGSPGGYLLHIGQSVEHADDPAYGGGDLPWGFYIDSTRCAWLESGADLQIDDADLLTKKGYSAEKVHDLIEETQKAIGKLYFLASE